MKVGPRVMGVGLEAQRYNVSRWHAYEVGGIDRFVIAIAAGAEPFAITAMNRNGTETFLTYKTKERAMARLARVRSSWPDAYVFEKEKP